MSNLTLTFCGAAGVVTGSKHLLDDGRHRILLDCGLEQGRGASTHQDVLPFEAATIDAVVVSHAHLDHVGLLPVLVKQGFRGTIYSTGATKDLAELILLDSAHLQEQDVFYAQKKRWEGWEHVTALYTTDDIPAVMACWQVLPYQFITAGWKEIIPGVKVKLYDAGHILGSAVTVIEMAGQRIAYSGDLGRQNAPLLRDPDVPIDTIATLILESTYGTRLHHPVSSVNATLLQAVKNASIRGGKIIVPAFSLGRTQELVYILHRMTDEGQLPRIPIVVDSPLASRVTEVFTRHQRDYDEATRHDFSRLGENPLAFSNLRYTQTVEESKALNSTPGPLMIISASGMASGGRVMHHLANNLADERNMILFTGYQATGTLGRALVENAKRIRLYGQSIPVRAERVVVNDLSAHADANELERYAASISSLERVYLVHGEEDRASGLRDNLLRLHPQWQVRVPAVGDIVSL